MRPEQEQEEGHRCTHEDRRPEGEARHREAECPERDLKDDDDPTADQRDEVLQTRCLMDGRPLLRAHPTEASGAVVGVGEAGGGEYGARAAEVAHALPSSPRRRCGKEKRHERVADRRSALLGQLRQRPGEIGRASCRERV